MQLLHKARMMLCLALISLLFFGKPICLNFDCKPEDSIDQFEVKSTDNVSYVHLALKTCTPIDLTCEKTSFNALLSPFGLDIANLRISVPIAIFTLCGLFQLVILLCGSSSTLNKKRMFFGLTFLDVLYCIELFSYGVQMLYFWMDSMGSQYFGFVSKYHVNYFGPILALHGIGFLAYLIEFEFYSSEKQTEANRRNRYKRRNRRNKVKR